MPVTGQIALNQLARDFECFFWRPSHGTRTPLTKTITAIRQSEFSLEGTDASALVARVLRCNGLLASSQCNPTDERTSAGLSANEIRSAVSATLHCLASSNARLFNTQLTQSLVHLLPAAEANGLLPELEALIARDRVFCGQHRVLGSIWVHAEHTGLPLLTIPILVYLSERLHYPIPDDAPLLRAIRLIQRWQQHQPPTHDEQDDFEAQLCALTGPETSPDDFTDLLEMAFDLGFCFTDESLYRLISRLIIGSDCRPRQDRCLIKLDIVLRLTGISADNIVIDQESALSRAVRQGNDQLFALLLEHGARPDQRDDQQPCVPDQLNRQRSALMSEIDEVVNARPEFTLDHYQKITARLLAQLRRNERMLNLLDQTKQAKE